MSNLQSWPKNESPTGRGFTQGSDSYNAYDVEQMEREEAKLKEAKLKEAKSLFEMDVDRCPIHGVGCA